MRIVLDIGSTDPLEGAVVVDGGDETPFAGWLQLLTLLDRVITSAPPADPILRASGVRASGVRATAGPSRQPTGLGS